MRLGITVDMSGPNPALDMERVLEAERLGFAQGVDRRGPTWHRCRYPRVTWILSRTSKIKAGHWDHADLRAHADLCAAMTVMTLQILSNNRFLCGLGVSGAQVVEWLARRALWQADDAHQGIYRNHPPDSWHARHRWNFTARNTTFPMLARTPPVSVVRCAASRTAIRIPCSTWPRSRHSRPAHRRGECADGVLPIFYSPEQPNIVSSPVLAGMKQAGRPETLAEASMSAP